MLGIMLPLSEADPEVKAAVEKIVGPCKCLHDYRSRWLGHATDRFDPHCQYHRIGEDIAELVRDNRRLKATLQRIHHQSRKAPK